MVGIPSADKNAYRLSVVEVHTRRVLIDLFAFSIKHIQVTSLLFDLFMNHQYPNNVLIKSDNRSQFLLKT